MGFIETFIGSIQTQIEAAFADPEANPFVQEVLLLPFRADLEIPEVLERFHTRAPIGLLTFPTAIYTQDGDPLNGSGLLPALTDATYTFIFAAVSNSGEEFSEGRAVWIMNAIDRWNDSIEGFIPAPVAEGWVSFDIRTAEANFFEQPELCAAVFTFTLRLRSPCHAA